MGGEATISRTMSSERQVTMLAENILEEGIHHRTMVGNICGGLDDRIAHLSVQLADIQNQVSASVETTAADWYQARV